MVQFPKVNGDKSSHSPIQPKGPSRAQLSTADLTNEVKGDAFQPAQIAAGVKNGSFVMNNAITKAPKHAQKTAHFFNTFMRKLHKH